jgi:hypothetical protein
MLLSAIAASGIVACGGSDSPAPGPTPPPPPMGPAVLVGAGDIGWCGASEPAETARILDGVPGTVITLGDNAYNTGSAENFAQCYDPNWGRHKNRTRPSPGNHDYETPGAAGYFDYFGAAAGPYGAGYYSYRAGSWLVLSLNSNVDTAAGGPQLQWLRSELASHVTDCAVAYFHHPLFSSGDHGNNLHMQPTWRVLYEAGVDLVLSGHDHLYERFAPQDPDGRADGARGIRQFIAGGGGAPLSFFRATLPNSQARAVAYGVLKLTLQTRAYEWEFLSTAGTPFRDMGMGVCH